MDNKPLAPDEIKTMLMFTDAFLTAQARMAQAAQMQQEYTQHLRDKYGLGPEWMCGDVLAGFVRKEGSE